MSQETSTFCAPIPPSKVLKKHTQKTPTLSLDPILTLFIYYFFLAYQVSLIIQIFYGKDSVDDVDDDDDCFMVTGHRPPAAIHAGFCP